MPPAPRPAVVVAHSADDAFVRDLTAGVHAGAPGVLDVVEVAVGADDVRAVLDAVVACGATRWLLVGHGEGVDAVARTTAEVLAGRAPVFGLAGVVYLTDAAPTSGGDLPTLLLPAEAVDVGAAGAAIGRFWRADAGRGPVVPADFVALLGSDRVAVRTRAIHARRVLADDPDHAPVALDATQLATLRVLAGRVVPQDGESSTWIDLAARVDVQLGAGAGDGWRHADLPPDVEAYRGALDELVGLTDPTCTPARQDAILGEMADGAYATTGTMSADRMALWFEDARVDLVRHWLAHPATMARIGYDGVGIGGEQLTGYTRLGAGERDDWEPQLLALEVLR